ncbi:hypothetical protein JOC77_004169 [Peribacillus deserti]|uniref:Uncharacterized protein n=1 Tax=Peribacillus deserti TaxID=673318 RepID=A0ABS2QNL1_9BACI|nr:hypothetical protein [Peribacillus deserti]MBM7694692.1 hypothetical protein [Peribacillus deserti]
MSVDHLRTMLNTLKQYSNCEISLTFNDNNQQPLLFVYYKNNLFEVINAQTLVVDTFEAIESTLTAIDNEIEHKFKKTST